MDCETIESLISAYVDGELLQFQTQQVENHVADCERCAATLAEYQRTSQEMQAMRFEEPTAQELRSARPQVVIKVTRGLGWALILGFVAAWLATGLVVFIADDASWLVKVGIMGPVLGITLLFVSVLHERLVVRKTDRYKEVQR